MDTFIPNIYIYLNGRGKISYLDQGQVLSFAWGIVYQHPDLNIDEVTESIIDTVHYLTKNASSSSDEINYKIRHLPEKGCSVDFDQSELMQLAWALFDKNPRLNLFDTVKRIKKAVELVKNKLPPVVIDKNNTYNRRLFSGDND